MAGKTARKPLANTQNTSKAFDLNDLFHKTQYLTRYIFIYNISDPKNECNRTTKASRGDPIRCCYKFIVIYVIICTETINLNLHEDSWLGSTSSFFEELAEGWKKKSDALIALQYGLLSVAWLKSQTTKSTERFEEKLLEANSWK